MIEGKKVILREINETDTDNIIAWRNNPRVRNQFIYRELLTKETHEKWLETQVKTGKVIQYIVVDKKTSIPIGSVYYSHVDLKNKTAEFGIFIGDDSSCGQGLGREAMDLFIRFGFEKMSLKKIYLRVISTNKIAHQLYLKMGFVDDEYINNVIEVNGKPIDIIMMIKYP